MQRQGGRVVRVCDEVLSRARKADPEAIATLYREYREVLYRAALRITQSHHDAEDLLHDLFVSLPKKLQSFENRGSLEGWLRRITVRAALATVAAREPGAHLRTEVNRGADVERRVLDRVTLHKALRELPAMYREVLILKEVEGRPHREIASMLGITVANSKVLLHRGRDRMKAILSAPP
jgi:RNA polymerase sigma factor (sigma-70 family)